MIILFPICGMWVGVLLVVLGILGVTGGNSLGMLWSCASIAIGCIAIFMFLFLAVREVRKSNKPKT